jgi:hypothetical protein
VTARPNDSTNAGAAESTIHEDNDQDLHRAKDLVELHAEVKVAHQDGANRELNDARDTVARVLRELDS